MKWFLQVLFAVIVVAATAYEMQKSAVNHQKVMAACIRSGHDESYCLDRYGLVARYLVDINRK